VRGAGIPTQGAPEGPGTIRSHSQPTISAAAGYSGSRYAPRLPEEKLKKMKPATNQPSGKRKGRAPGTAGVLASSSRGRRPRTNAPGRKRTQGKNSTGNWPT